MNSATRKNRRTARSPLGKSSSPPTTSPRSTLLSGGLSGWLRPICGFLVGTLIVWSFLTPADATSVFRGEALAQNLFWLLAACCAAVAARHVGVRFSPLAWTAALVSLGCLLFVTLQAGQANNPRIVWNGGWQLISLAACYFCLRGCLVGELSRSAAISIVLTGCVACSLQGLYQVQVEIPATRAAYLEDPDQSLRDAGVVAPPGSPARVRFENRLLESNEPYANFALANSLAVILSAGLILTVGLLLLPNDNSTDDRSREASTTPWYRQGSFYCLAATFSIIFACWLLTRSRAAYAAVVVAALPTLAWTLLRGGEHVRAGRSLAIAGSACIVAASLAGGWLWFNDRLVLSEARKSLGYRVEYWQATLRMIGDYRWTGVGLGNFQSHYPLYKLATASEEIADPHNWILDLLVTLGLFLGSIVVAAVLYMLAKGLSSAWTRAGCHSAAPMAEQPDASPNHQALDRRLQRSLLAGAVLGGAFCGMLLWLLKLSDILVWLTCWGIAGILIRGCMPRIYDVVRNRPYWIAAGPAAMMIALLATGSWQASGIAVPLLVLLTAARQVPYADEKTSGSMSTAAIVLSISGMIAFICQAWLPTTGAWSLLQQAQLAGGLTEQISLTESAIAADPLDTDLRGFSAQGYVQRAQQTRAADFSEAASRAIRELDSWLERDSGNFTNWRQAGNMSLDLAAAAEQLGQENKELVDRAVAYYQQAVNRYPSSVELRIQVAAAAAFAQRWSLATQEIETAIELSATTPHEDKKLGRHQTLNQGAGDQMVWLPLSGGPENARTSTPNMVLAEPLIEWIRKQAQPEE